jgi:hypothetical protein
MRAAIRNRPLARAALIYLNAHRELIVSGMFE